MEDFANAIAYEVKQEIASRYFGFRTRTEDWCKKYLEKVQTAANENTQSIRLDLCRMQYLLQEPRLFCVFLDLIGLPREDIHRIYSLPQSPLGIELFSEMRGRGFTRWRRFRGLAMLVYKSLADNIVIFRDTYLQLEEEHTDICLEIEKFQRQNNLSDILCFLRNLDSPDVGRLKFLHANSNLLSSTSLETDLRIPPPPPVSETLLLFNLLPPVKQIQEQFTVILKQAFSHHDCQKPSSIPF